MSRSSFRSLRAFVISALTVVAVAAVTTAARAQDGTVLDPKEEAKVCKQRTKTMGCTLESLGGAARAGVVAAGGPLGGKCQIDSPAVEAEVRTYTSKGLRCDDPSIADTGDQMIDLCKQASTAVRTKCRTICSKLNKIDPDLGDPIPEVLCRMVVDRTVVTTKTERRAGPDGCKAMCEASIVCVCDP